VAFAAGLVAALNPCGFALLPAYLTFVIDGDTSPGRPVAVARAAAATVAMTLGFLAVFAIFGALTVPVASEVQRYLPAVTVVVGVALVAVGLWLLAGYRLRMPTPPPERWAPTARLGSMFGYGVAYAVSSLSCTIGPFLAVTAAGARSGSAAGAATVYLVYAGGFALIVGNLAIAAAFACSALANRIVRLLPIVNRIGGALVILVGLYVGYYGSYELRLFGGGGDPRDAVISAAGRVQGALVAWVHGHGGGPWILLLVVLLACAAVWAWRLRRGLASVRRQQQGQRGGVITRARTNYRPPVED
jgi:cytochrome c biogenesis protein CcdA